MPKRVAFASQRDFNRMARAVRAYERSSKGKEGGGAFGKAARVGPVAIGITRNAVANGGTTIVDLYSSKTRDSEPEEIGRSVTALMWTGLEDDETLQSNSKVFLVRIGARWVLSEWNCSDIV